jgi:hypothetical protein
MGELSSPRITAAMERSTQVICVNKPNMQSNIERSDITLKRVDPLLTHTNRLTWKLCSLRGPYDNYEATIEQLLESVFSM